MPAASEPVRVGALSAEGRGIGLRVGPPSKRHEKLKPHRSLYVTDVEILEKFSFEKVMRALAGQAGPNLTAEELFRQWWATQNDDQSCPSCKYAYEKRPGEAELANDSPFSDGDSGFMAIGLFNRIDLAEDDCGEYRMVFARKSGATSGGRLLIAFEAVLPSPTGDRAGCKPIAEFWRSLSDEDDPGKRAKKLLEFYFTGLPEFPPAVHIDNYGARECPKSVDQPVKPCPTGQIRTNQFMDNVWVLGEFVIRKDSSQRAGVRIVPEPVAETPHGELFCCPPDESQEKKAKKTFREELLRAVPSLATRDPLCARYEPALGLEFNASRAVSHPNNDTDYLGRLASESGLGTLNDLRKAIKGKLPSGSTLGPDDILARAQGLSCSGCHHLNNDLTRYGAEMTFSRSGGFPSLGHEHVTERRIITNADRHPAYQISELVRAQLKRRKWALWCILDSCKPGEPRDTCE